MQLYLDYEKLRAHEAYVEDVRKQVLRLCENVRMAQDSSEDPVVQSRYRKIRDMLQAVSDSMKARTDLLEDIVHEFADTDDRIDDDLQTLRRVLDDLEIL